MTIRVVHVGLGPIGAAVARQLAVRKGFRIVAAVDIDPNKIGRDVGEVAECGRSVRVKVTGDLRKAVKAAKPDVAVLCTSSSLKAVMPQLEELLKLRLPVVSTTEELAYPAPANRRLAKNVDQMARKAKVAVLGTGVNPGFAMDALPIARCAASRTRASGGCRSSRRSAPGSRASSSSSRSPRAPSATSASRNRSR